MSIPNPISLQQLRDCYDTLVALLSSSSSSSSDVRSLRLVCSILMTVLGPSNAWKDRLQQTARRCHLIERYLTENIDDDDDDDESFLMSIQVSVQPHNDVMTSWAWSMEDDTKDFVALSMDRDELIREEVTLWDMANTPIPVGESFGESSPMIWQRKNKLLQEIRFEWEL
ncbi:hypothetical protein FisN_29Lh106 [Fistulifera solaris]|uniref:Uncharacterized protein n=1 Tax=Fistulifera solaris TaxID=1519565 RepID=A0A1Z5JLK2_FISSO|nr:hypothetical protein FisN_29Lh106 [Fistulifera solaris]|eukprot:GAX14890.1 hypothetical protein FisN_29Lh106 [Fistulifera solaris]